MRKSGLIVITELFLPTKGGTAVWFDAVYRRLGGKEIHVVTANVPGAELVDSDHPNEIHRVSLRRRWWLKPESLAMYLKLFAVSLRIGFGHRVSGVHAGRVLPEGLVGWLVARLIGKPFVVYAHGEEITTWREPMKRRVMTFVYRHADQIVANSEFTRTELMRLGVAMDKIALIAPGVDIEKFQPIAAPARLRESLGISPSHPLILSVGRLSRRKGFDNVVRALSALRQSGLDVHYVVIGIGEDESYLRKTARDLDLGDRVHLIGHVPVEDLSFWYNTCDVFAMPNRDIDGDTEGFGMVFLEAAACGKPAVAGVAGGTGAAVVDGVTGMRVDGASVDAVASAFRELLSSRDKAAKLGAAGYARVLREFSWDSVARRTTQVMNGKP